MSKRNKKEKEVSKIMEILKNRPYTTKSVVYRKVAKDMEKLNYETLDILLLVIQHLERWGKNNK